MHTLLALVAVVTACVVARPPAAAPAPTVTAAQGQMQDTSGQNQVAPGRNLVGPGQSQVAPERPLPGRSIDDYILPHFQAVPVNEYPDGGLEDLYREIGYIDQYPDGADNGDYLNRLTPSGQRYKPYMENYYRQLVEEFKRTERQNELNAEPVWLPNKPPKQYELKPIARYSTPISADKAFALTPLDPGYFDALDPEPAAAEKTKQPMKPSAMIDPRRTRQNPNLSRTKSLVASNLDKLRIGLANKEYRMPVSLLPANLNWLKIGQPNDVEERSEEPGTSAGTDQPEVHIYDTEITEAHPGSLVGVALVTGLSAALVLAVVGFVFGWFTLSKRAKAAADVDYPAYGVTGPTADISGDRKLAHSAHMYHYQHQKQQIIAMESNGNDTRNGSVSEPESEEENEEGDYTVYECPGFATTGDMEVKNPLFTDDQTPATPGKCEIVKPQPK